MIHNYYSYYLHCYLSIKNIQNPGVYLGSGLINVPSSNVDDNLNVRYNKDTDVLQILFNNKWYDVINTNIQKAFILKAGILSSGTMTLYNNGSYCSASYSTDNSALKITMGTCGSSNSLKGINCYYKLGNIIERNKITYNKIYLNIVTWQNTDSYSKNPFYCIVSATGSILKSGSLDVGINDIDLSSITVDFYISIGTSCSWDSTNGNHSSYVILDDIYYSNI